MGFAFIIQSLNTSLPATWKAMSFESTGCSFPPYTIARTSTTLYPAMRPAVNTCLIPFYTDGITEAARAKPIKIDEKYFGEERLVEVVKKSLHMSAREIQSEILQAISDFTEGAPQNDDVTLVVIKRSPQP